MKAVGLYALTVLIWGTTWFAVTLQTGPIAPEVSVAYRFALASLLFFGYAISRRIRLTYPTSDHAWIALQGLLLASSFICIYVATTWIASGLVAIVFSLVAILNVVGTRLFFRTRLHARMLLGAVLGVVGILMIFGPEVPDGPGREDLVIGLSISVGSALSASLAGMVIVRNQRRQIPMVPLNGFSLLYGAAFAGIYALLLDKPLAFEWSLRYIGSLLYLSLVGSVLVFAAFLELIRHIGVERAGYVAVASPVLALLMSSAFEALRLELLSLLGLLVCLVGNVLVLRNSAHFPAVPR